jgi:hypothetical protein
MAKRFLNTEAAHSGSDGSEEDHDDAGEEEDPAADDATDSEHASQQSGVLALPPSPPARLPAWVNKVARRVEAVQNIIAQDRQAQEAAANAGAHGAEVMALAEPLGRTVDDNPEDDENFQADEFDEQQLDDAEEAQQMEEGEANEAGAAAAAAAAADDYQPVWVRAPPVEHKAPVFPPTPVNRQRPQPAKQQPPAQPPAQPQQAQRRASHQPSGQNQLPRPVQGDRKEQSPFGSGRGAMACASVESRSLGRAPSPLPSQRAEQDNENDLIFCLPFPLLHEYTDLTLAPRVEPAPDRLEGCTLAQLLCFVDDWLRLVQGEGDSTWDNPGEHVTRVWGAFYSKDRMAPLAHVLQFRRMYTAWITFLSLFVRRASLEETKTLPERAVIDKLEQITTLMNALADVSVGCARASTGRARLHRVCVCVLALCVCVCAQLVIAFVSFPRLCSRHATSQNYHSLLDYPSDIRHVLPDYAQAGIEFVEFCVVNGYAKSPQGTVLERVFYTPPGTNTRLFTGTYAEMENRRDNNLPVSVEKLIHDWAVGGRAGIASVYAKTAIIKHLSDLFTKAEHFALPTWAPQRCVFAFPHVNGCIYYFDFNPRRDPETGDLLMRFVPALHPTAAGMMPCMFFDEPIDDEIIDSVIGSAFFPDCVDPRYPDVRMDAANPSESPHWWQGVPTLATPVFDKVLGDQFAGGCAERGDPEHPMLVIAVVCALLGRWLRPLNTTDHWQKLVYFIGDGGTGKSLLFSAMRRWFPSHRIANLAARMEKQFGLDGFQNAWGVLGDELRGEIGIPTTALLSMTSGDSVKISVKGKQAIDKHKWDAAIVAAGNEMVVEFVDVKGSWQRRLVILPCNVTVAVENRDERLKVNVLKEAGFILLKCCAAYRALLDWLKLTNSQFDNFIDRTWFTAQAAELLESKAKIDEFLDSGPLVFDMVQKDAPQISRIYMPLDELGKVYRHWCQRRGYFVKGQWNGSVYGNPFNARNIVVPRNEHGLLSSQRQWPDRSGLQRNTVYVMGVDLAKDASRDDVPEYLHARLDIIPDRANVQSAAEAANQWRRLRRQKREREVHNSVHNSARAAAEAAASGVGSAAAPAADADAHAGADAPFGAGQAAPKVARRR